MWRSKLSRESIFKTRMRTEETSFGGGSHDGGLGVCVTVATELPWPYQQGGSNGVFAKGPVGWFGHCLWSRGFQTPLSGPLGDRNYLIFFSKFIFCLHKLEWIPLFATKNSKHSPFPASCLVIPYTQCSSYPELLSFPNITDWHCVLPLLWCLLHCIIITYLLIRLPLRTVSLIFPSLYHASTALSIC